MFLKIVIQAILLLVLFIFFCGCIVFEREPSYIEPIPGNSHLKSSNAVALAKYNTSCIKTFFVKQVIEMFKLKYEWNCHDQDSCSEQQMCCLYSQFKTKTDAIKDVDGCRNDDLTFAKAVLVKLLTVMKAIYCDDYRCYHFIKYKAADGADEWNQNYDEMCMNNFFGRFFVDFIALSEKWKCSDFIICPEEKMCCLLIDLAIGMENLNHLDGCNERRLNFAQTMLRKDIEEECRLEDCYQFGESLLYSGHDLLQINYYLIYPLILIIHYLNFYF